MRIVRPVPVTDGNMTTNASESIPAWNSSTNYAPEQQAIYGHYIYEARQAGSNRRPDISPDHWFVAGPTNKWAMFDQKTGTQTVRASSLQVAVDVEGYADTIGLLNIDAAWVNITVTSGPTLVSSESIPLVDNSAVTDYYEYFFAPIVRRTDVVVPLKPDIYNPRVSATLTDPGAEVKAGHMVVGMARYIGDAVYGARLSGTDLSKVDQDEFGTFDILERPYNRTGQFTVWLTAGMVDEVYKIVTGYRATPVLVIGTEQYGASLYFGLLRDAQIEIAYPSHSIMSLEVRGL